MKGLKKCIALLLTLLMTVPFLIPFAGGENGFEDTAKGFAVLSDEVSDIASENSQEDSSNGDAHEKLDMTVMTFNIRYQNSSDTGVRSWDSRKQVISDFILDQGASIVCMQEVKPVQNEYLSSALSSKYSMVWYGRDGSGGEGLAIAYDKNVWKLIEQGRFWISETPDEISYGWGATIRRICVTAVLEHKITGARIGVYNIHLDNKAEAARTNGIKLVLDRIADCEYPVYLCGDFNAKKTSEAYNIASAAMNDGQNAPVTDSGSTYNGWGTYTEADQNIIDYTFFGKDWFELISYDICTDKWGDNSENFLSDHYAIKSTVKMLYKPGENLEETPGEDILEDIPNVETIEGSNGTDGNYSKNY